MIRRRWLAIPPIFYLAPAFAAGIGAGRALPTPFLFSGVFALVCLVWMGFSVHRRIFIPASILTFLALGFFIQEPRFLKTAQAASALSGQATLEGVVVSVPEPVIRGRKETLSFILDRSQPARGKARVVLHNPRREIRFGDKVLLRGTLAVPEPARNPHVFDYARYLKNQGIGALFQGIGRGAVLGVEPAGRHPVLAGLHFIRTFLAGRLHALLPHPHAELAKALVLGFRRNIPQEITDDFVRTGTAHILAISGLHIVLVGHIFSSVARFFRIGRLPNLVLTAGVIGLYTVLAGGDVPVMRAGLMGGVVLAGLVMGRDRDLRSAFFAVMLFLLAVYPGFLFQPSFQLSFAAVASLLFLTEPIKKILCHPEARPPEDGSAALLVERAEGSLIQRFFAALRMTSEGLRMTTLENIVTSLAITLGMAPILIWYFNLFSWVGFLANLIAIPLSTAMVVSTFFALIVDIVCVPAAKLIAGLALIFSKLQLGSIAWLARIPFSCFYVPSPPWFFFLVYYGLLSVWLVSWKRPVFSWVRHSLVAAILLVSVGFAWPRRPADLAIVFFDLGKTDSAFLSLPDGSTVLVNAGRRFPSNQAYWVLRPFLMGSGIQSVDHLLLTQMDGSHAGGFQTLERHVPVKNILVPAGAFTQTEWAKYLGRQGVSQRTQEMAERDFLGIGADVSVRILAVARGRVTALKIQAGARSVLYLNTLDKETLDSLLGHADLQSDVLFLPHLKRDVPEQAEQLLKRIHPAIVVSNQRGLPDQSHTRLRLPAHSQLLSIEDLGAIELRSSKGGWTIKTYGQKPTGKS